jgi:hypothetical protein
VLFVVALDALVALVRVVVRVIGIASVVGHAHGCAGFGHLGLIIATRLIG